MPLRHRKWAVLSVARFSKGLGHGRREREREEKKKPSANYKQTVLISKDIRSGKQIATEITILCLSHSAS